MLIIVNNPYTLSRQVTTAILRDEIRLKGFVISDDLQMRAIAERKTLLIGLSLKHKIGLINSLYDSDHNN